MKEVVFVPFDFDQVIERRRTDSLKWDSVDEKLLPMWVADMDFACPPEVVEALVKRAEHGVFGYAIPSNNYNQAVIDWMQKRHRWAIEREWILTCPGVVSALDVAVRALTEPGDKVLIQVPVYHPFFSVVRNNNRILVENELKYDGARYHMDFEDLEQKLASGVKMMLLCSPHNPVGRVWTTEELKQLGDLCRKHQVMVVADEIHADVVYPGYQHQVFSTAMPDLAQQSVICTAANKTFNIAGLQAANIIIANPKVRKQFQRVLATSGLGLPGVFAATALVAAYNYGTAWLDELLDYLADNLTFIKSFAQEHLPGVKIIEPEATYLAWLDFHRLDLDDEQLKELITRAGLVFNSGSQFGPGGEGFLRLNFACSRIILAEGLERLARVWPAK
ncbi:MAG: MalY/PatB family protein [Methanomassiliicoccales archaeon]